MIAGAFFFKEVKAIAYLPDRSAIARQVSRSLEINITYSTFTPGRELASSSDNNYGSRGVSIQRYRNIRSFVKVTQLSN